MTRIALRGFIRDAMIVALVAIVLCVACAASVHACACPIPPAPVPCAQLYLPLVQRDMPGMAAEYAPAQPVATVTPVVPVTGDVR